MKQVPVRDFQLRANDYLSELPIALTRYGRVVAIVQSPDMDPKVKEVVERIKTLPKRDPVPLGMVKKETTYVPEKIKQKPPVEVEFHLSAPIMGERFWVCPHGNESGQCIEGCVK
jgi:hypothetical protein